MQPWIQPGRSSVAQSAMGTFLGIIAVIALLILVGFGCLWRAGRAVSDGINEGLASMEAKPVPKWKAPPEISPDDPRLARIAELEAAQSADIKAGKSYSVSRVFSIARLQSDLEEEAKAKREAGRLP
jgi:hypothetical protein